MKTQARRQDKARRNREVPMSLRGILICLLIALSLAAPAAAAATKDTTTGGLPRGKPNLKETRTTQQVTPGKTYTRIVRG